MPDEPTIDPQDEFEQLGRLAGAQLRAAAPAGELAGITRTVARRKRVKAGLITASVVVVAWMGIALATGSPDSERLQTVPPDGPTSTTSAPGAGATPRVVISGFQGNVMWIAISTDGRTGAAVSDGGSLLIWDPSTGEVRRTITVGGDQASRQVALSPDAGRVAVQLDDGAERFWSVGTGERASSFDVSWTDPPAGPPPATFTSDDGARQVQLGRFGPVTMTDPATGAVLETLAEGSAMPYTAAFSLGGSLVAVKFSDRVQVWDTSTFESVATFALPKYGSTAEHLVFLPDGHHVAFTVEDTVIVETIPSRSTSPGDGTERETDAIVPTAADLTEGAGGRWTESDARRRGEAVSWAECVQPSMSGEIEGGYARREAIDTVDARFRSAGDGQVVVQVAVLSSDQVAWNTMNSIAESLTACSGSIPTYLSDDFAYPDADHAYASADPPAAMVTVDNVLAIVTAPSEATRDAIVEQIIRRAGG